MKTATETLIATTWLAEDKFFACHDKVTQIDWESFNVDDYTDEQVYLINVLSYLDDKNSFVTLSDIGNLEENERNSVLEALKIKWSGIQMEENL